MRKRINFTDWLEPPKKNLLIIYSKIYSEFTFSRLGGTCFLEPLIAQITLIFSQLH